jgi:hypothetical protein
MKGYNAEYILGCVWPFAGYQQEVKTMDSIGYTTSYDIYEAMCASLCAYHFYEKITMIVHNKMLFGVIGIEHMM